MAYTKSIKDNIGRGAANETPGTPRRLGGPGGSFNGRHSIRQGEHGQDTAQLGKVLQRLVSADRAGPGSVLGVICHFSVSAGGTGGRA